MAVVVSFANLTTQRKRRTAYYRAVRRVAVWRRVETRWMDAGRQVPPQVRRMIDKRIAEAAALWPLN